MGVHPPHLRVAFLAIAVSRRAISGRLARSDVGWLDAFATDRLAADHPVRQSVGRFVAKYDEVFRSEAAVIAAGEGLYRDVLRATRPTPPGADRADLNG